MRKPALAIKTAVSVAVIMGCLGLMTPLAASADDVADGKTESGDIEGNHLPTKTLDLPVEDKKAGKKAGDDTPPGPDPE